mgnify:CR=1 FL=1
MGSHPWGLDAARVSAQTARTMSRHLATRSYYYAPPMGRRGERVRS